MNANTRCGLLLPALLTLAALWPAAAAAAIGDHISSTASTVNGLSALDGAGNTVLYGAFFGTIDLGGGPMTSVNFLDGDQYLARFDPAGNHLWSLQFSPTGGGVTDEALAVDTAGNIYVAGKVFQNADLDYGGGPFGASNVYVARFDTAGNLVWSDGYGDGWVEGLATDGTHVAVVGYTSVGIDFGGGTVGAAGGNDVFVGSFTAAGTHAWSAGFGDADDQGAFGVDIDGTGNVLLVGTMFGTANFGGTAFVANGLDLFLASFTATGAHNWSQTFDGQFAQGAGIGTVVQVTVGATGQVAIAGEVSGSTDFGGGTLTSNGQIDAYVASFDAAGSHLFSGVYGSSASFDQAIGVDMDGAGNVLIVGTYRGDADFGGGIVPFAGDPLNFDSGLFVAVYDDAGAHLFSQGYGTKATGTGCSFFANGDLRVLGRSTIPIDMGGGPIAQTGRFEARLEGAGGGVSAVGDVPTLDLPLSAAPNPFNPNTVIAYELPVAGPASVTVFNVRGQLVEKLVPERPHAAGLHRVRFAARGSGVYLVRLEVAGRTRTLKTVAIK